MRRYFIVIIFVLLLTAPAAIGGDLSSMVLEIRDARTGKIYYSWTIEAGALIKLKFLHSYDRFPCWDFYEVNSEGRFVFLKTGGRSVFNGQGFSFRGYRNLADGTWEISSINEIRENISFFMGTKGDAEHSLEMAQGTVNLSERIEPGTLVVIKVGKKGGIDGLDKRGK